MKWVLALLMMMPGANLGFSQAYVPPPESAGGWRWCKTPDEVRKLGGMDPDKLQLIKEKQLMFVMKNTNK